MFSIVSSSLLRILLMILQRSLHTKSSTRLILRFKTYFLVRMKIAIRPTVMNMSRKSSLLLSPFVVARLMVAKSNALLTAETTLIIISGLKDLFNSFLSSRIKYIRQTYAFTVNRGETEALSQVLN